jgi:hypothetical protein
MGMMVLGLVGAASIAGAIVTWPGFSPRVEASGVARKGDRLDLSVRIANRQPRAWPYEQSCLKTGRQPIRLVTTDRL